MTILLYLSSVSLTGTVVICLYNITNYSNCSLDLVCSVDISNIWLICLQPGINKKPCIKTPSHIIFYLQLTHRLQDPSDSAVTAAANHFEVVDILEHAEALHRTACRQVVDLARIQDVLELPEDAAALSTPRFGVDEHQQRHRVVGGGYLERHGGLLVRRRRKGALEGRGQSLIDENVQEIPEEAAILWTYKYTIHGMLNGAFIFRVLRFWRWFWVTVDIGIYRRLLVLLVSG